MNKQEFIKAYMYQYGETKKKALEVYEDAYDSYITETIKEYKDECKKAFYED